MGRRGTALNITRQRLGEIPLLLVSEGDALGAAQRGTILFFHGLGVSKEVQLPDLTSLARHGFLAVGVDNAGHGERRYPDFERRFSEGNSSRNEEFLQAVLETAREVPILVEELTRQGLVSGGRMGHRRHFDGRLYHLCSLDARAPPQSGCIDCRVARMDAGLAREFTPSSSQVCPRRALVANGGPGRYARVFHERREEFYGDYAERFAYHDYPDSDHLLDADWDRLWVRTLEWFDKYLV